MKRYVVISLAGIAAILALLSSSVLSQKPDAKMEAFHQSLKHETAGDYQKAVADLLPIYKQQNDDYLLHLRLGWLQYQNKNYKESKKYYSQAVQLTNSKSIEALLGSTLPLAALNEWNAVEEAYQSILKLDPMHYTANLRLGQILLNKGLYADAKAFLEKLHTYYPAAYEPNLSLGWTYYYLGERKKAGDLLTTALLLSPGDTLAIKGLSLVK